MSSMTENTTYNGWKNYPTWSVSLWMENDEQTYRTACEIVTDALASSSDFPRVRVADALKDWTRELVELDEASLAADLLGYALDQVDWLEIADAWIETVNEQD